MTIEGFSGKTGGDHTEGPFTLNQFIDHLSSFTPPDPPRPSSVHGNGRRQLDVVILAATEALIIEGVPPDSITTREIATRANAQQPSIHEIFRTRDYLLERVFKDASTRVVETIIPIARLWSQASSFDDAQNRLFAGALVVDRLVEWLFGDPMCAKLIADGVVGPLARSTPRSQHNLRPNRHREANQAVPEFENQIDSGIVWTNQQLSEARRLVQIFFTDILTITKAGSDAEPAQLEGTALIIMEAMVLSSLQRRQNTLGGRAAAEVPIGLYQTVIRATLGLPPAPVKG